MLQELLSKEKPFSLYSQRYISSAPSLKASLLRKESLFENISKKHLSKRRSSSTKVSNGGVIITRRDSFALKIAKQDIVISKPNEHLQKDNNESHSHRILLHERKKSTATKKKDRRAVSAFEMTHTDFKTRRNTNLRDTDLLIQDIEEEWIEYVEQPRMKHENGLSKKTQSKLSNDSYFKTLHQEQLSTKCIYPKLEVYANVIDFINAKTMEYSMHEKKHEHTTRHIYIPSSAEFQRVLIDIGYQSKFVPLFPLWMHEARARAK